MVSREAPRCPICDRSFGRPSGMLRHLSNAADAAHAAAMAEQVTLALQARDAGLTCHEAAQVPGMWFGHDRIARRWRAHFGAEATDLRHRQLLAERTRAHHAAHPDFNHLKRHRYAAAPGRGNPFFGRKHSVEARAAMSKAHSGKTISEAQKAKFREAHARRYPTAEAWREEVRARFARNPAAREKLRSARLAQRFLKSWTKPERVMAGMLDHAGRSYEHHVPLGGVGIVDFLVGSTIIEVFGDYWHANPTCFPRPDARQVQQREKDEARRRAYEALGYRVEVFWEDDLHRRPAACEARLAAIEGEANHAQLP